MSLLVFASYNQLDQHIIEVEIDNLPANNFQIKSKVDNMQTISGISKLTAIAILAEFPDLDSFNSARELAVYAGLTPKHKISGTSVKEKSTISKIDSVKLCKALYFPATVAKKI